MTALLWFTTFFVPSSAIPQAAIFAEGTTSTITQIVHANTDTFTTVNANVTTGQGLVYITLNEGAVPSLTITDPCSDTWTNQIGNNSGGSAGVAIIWTKATCGFSIGSTITSSFSGPTFIYSISPFSSSSAQDQDATAPLSGATSWSAGPTSTQTGTGLCFVGAAGASSPTFSVGMGWTIAPGTNNLSNGDSRVLFAEFAQYASGNTVTGTATASGSSSGGMAVKCLKQS